MPNPFFPGQGWIKGFGGMPSVQIRISLRPGSMENITDAGRIADRMVDLKPILDRLPEAVIFPSVLQSFAAGGRPPWNFKGYQSTPPMVKRGLMKRGLTTRDPGLNKVTVTGNTLTFELLQEAFIHASMVGDWGRRKGGKFKEGFFYPAAHQYGPLESSRHNQNVVLNLQEEDVEKIGELLSAYIEEGRLP